MSFKEQVAIGYATEQKVLGAIVVVSFLDEMVVLMEQNGNLVEATFDEVIELEEIGVLGKTTVYSHDVLSTEDGERQYEVVLNDEGLVEMYPLDDELNRLEGLIVSEPFHPDDINHYTGVLAVVGNIFELREALPKVDFNVAVVKHIDENDDEITYFQVGNLADRKEVDLVKAIMVEGEPYDRITMSHREFLELIEMGFFKMVEPAELDSYIADLFFGEGGEVEGELIHMNPKEEEDEEDEDTCAICHEHVEDCDCELWIK